MAARLRLLTLVLTAQCGALAALVMLIAGCGPPSAEQKLKQAYKDNPKAKEFAIAPFEGTVSVDGKPPAPGTKLIVMLCDPKHPQDPTKAPKLMVRADDDGHFVFSTLGQGDGVEEGSYIVTFLQVEDRLGHIALPGARRKSGMSVNKSGPDLLKNLYNDPDKNAEIAEFKVSIKKPGITNAHFDLIVEGKEPVTTPGPHAITSDTH